MRGRNFLAGGLLVVAASSALFISIIGWKCEMGYSEPGRKSMADSPPNQIRPTTTNNDIGNADGVAIIPREAASVSSREAFDPPYLRWNETPPEVPQDWTFVRPRFCNHINVTNPDFDSAAHGDKQKIVVHFHMQHNAGTNFWGFVKRHTPCALRACWQESKHCLVSYNEQVEAENIRQNYEKYGIQYVSYELMLPPRFPLPFVSETARRGFFFTTLVRDPFKRFFTYVRRYNFTDNGHDAHSPFWIDLYAGQQSEYSGDNLNARWLSGAKNHVDTDHVNIAKCRLQLFDLVIVDNMYQPAVKKVICPLFNAWAGKRVCNNTAQRPEHQSSKPDPLNGTDPSLIGAWVERVRPSFEIYDYARLLSWKQLKERGVDDLPEFSEVPSYMATLAKYANMNVTDAHLRKIPRVSLENEEHFHPPVEFCNHMKQVWMNNPDVIPNVFGIGTLRKGSGVRYNFEDNQ